MLHGKSSRLLWILFALIAVGALAFAACDDDDDDGDGVTPTVGETPTAGETPAADIGEVSVLGLWGTGTVELDAFEAVVAAWEALGGDMDFVGSRDIDSILTIEAEGGNLPDVSLPAALATFKALVASGDAVPLEECLNLDDLEAAYGASLDDLTIDGTVYGFFFKSSSKGAGIWYSPKQFTANGYVVPETFAELIALSDQMVADGNTPWSVAEFANGGSGFPGSDFIQEAVIHEWGPDVYDQWVANEIPYNDDRIKASWQKYGQILFTDGYTLQAPDAIVATSFLEGNFPLFESDPPAAFMQYMPSFNAGVIPGTFTDLVAEEDFDFFEFPTIDPDYADTVTGDGNIAMIFNSDSATCSFIEHISTGAAQSEWAKLGGYTSVNKEIAPASYPGVLDRRAAEQLAGPNAIFRFDAGDGMPAGVGGGGGAEFAGILEYITGGDLDAILQDIDDAFPE